MTGIARFAESLGCRALRDGLLYVFFLLALAALTTACIFAMRWLGHCFADRPRIPRSKPHSQKEQIYEKSYL